MFDDILVPTDGSECAEVAVGYAEDVARHFEARVHVLCVVDSRYVETGPHYDRIKAESTDIVEKTCNRISTTGRLVEQAVRTDVPHRAILNYVTENDIDLVVMGTHGRTGVERYLLGSVTEKVIRRSDVPVFTVSAPDDGRSTFPYSDVLVPTDGSKGAAAAIEPAIEIANAYDARLHALSVVDTMALGIDVRSDVLLEALEAAAQSAVDSIAEQATHAGVSTVRTALEHGKPYKEIRSYVETQDIDLVVMGTHGRSGIERYLLGSVTEKTVRTSPVPVLTVRLPDSG